MSSSEISTRSSTTHEIFGKTLEKLPEHQLAQEFEVVCHFLHLKNSQFDQSYYREGKLVKVLKPATKFKIFRQISE